MAGAANPAMTQPNVYGQASQAYQGALGGTVAAGQMPDIAAFQNPYTQQVIENTARDIGAAQQQAMNQLGAQATAARAFGGSRQGVAEAATNQAFIKQLADMSAQQRQAGFNTALGAAQQQRGQQLAAAGQLGNLAQTGFGFGQAIQGQQMQQGAMQQALQQALIDAARGQYAGFAGAPQQSLALPLQALGAAPISQTTTQTRQRGLFDYLTMGAGILASPMTGGGSLLSTLMGR